MSSPSNSPSHWSMTKVPANGALIKINDGKEKSSLGNVPKVLPGYRKRASTLGVISEQSEHKHSNEHLRISEDDTCKRPVNQKPIISPSRNNVTKPALKPTAKAGTIKALGEHMRGKFHIEDQVLALVCVPTSPTSPTSPSSTTTTSDNDVFENEVIRNVAIRGTDYVIVSDAIGHIFPLPETISLPVAARLGDKGVQALALVQALELKCHELLDQLPSDEIIDKQKSSKIKILLVCTDEMSLLAIPIIFHKLESVLDRIQLTAATLTDDGIVWLKKNFPRVCLVQWNNDAYEQVLLERTKDACKGLLDVVVSFDCAPRALLRSINCLKKGGTLICSEDVIDSVWKNIESNTKGQGKFGQKIDFRSPAIVQHLLDLVSDEKISLPPMVRANNMKQKLSSPMENQIRIRSYSTEE